MSEADSQWPNPRPSGLEAPRLRALSWVDARVEMGLYEFRYYHFCHFMSPPGAPHPLPTPSSNGPTFETRAKPVAITAGRQPILRHAQYVHAYAALREALQSSAPLVTLTGAPGVGKTTVLHDVLNESSCSATHILHVQSTHLHGDELLRYVYQDLTGTRSPRKGQGLTLTQKIEACLRELHAGGRRVLLAIDEAHALPRAAWSRVDELLAMGEHGSRTLRMIAAGLDPASDAGTSMCATSRMRLQNADVRLAALSPPECRHFIDHQLAVGGHLTQPGPSAEVYALAYTLTGGVPARIRQLLQGLLLLHHDHSRAPPTSADLLEVMRLQRVDALGGGWLVRVR